MANNPVEFRATFKEFLPLYRDVTRVWIGDGSSSVQSDHQLAGMLYAEYATGDVAELGYVTLYDYASNHGYSGSVDDWTAGVISLVAMNKGATISVKYQTTTNGTTHPDADSSGWSNSPNPQKVNMYGLRLLFNG